NAAHRGLVSCPTRRSSDLKEVNLASRLESLAEAGEILVSYETFSLIKDRIMCRDKGEITVKGFAKPVSIYEVVDFRRDMGPNRRDRKSTRLNSSHVKISYA